MKQASKNTGKKKHKTTLSEIQLRFRKLTDFIRTQPEEVINTSMYANLLSDMDGFLNEVLATIAEAPDYFTARQLHGETLCTLLVLRGEFKDELALHERTRRLSGRKTKCDRKSSSHYFRMRSLKQEFGSAIRTIDDEFATWKEIPDEIVCRVSVNQEIDQLLRQQGMVSRSLSKQQKMSDKYDAFLYEMEKRIVDCRHVLMITKMTDRDEKRERNAFKYLYEAVVYRKKLLVAGAVFRQACRKMII